MAELSPFVEATYGWPYSFDGWNGDMDQNLVKFSYLHDRNIDAIVSSLPAVVNGKAYFNTSDNRLYFDANGQRYSSAVPKWFEVTLRTTGEIYQFNGSALVLGSVGFIQTGSGAVVRTNLSKMRESVTPLDFGCVGDGVTDDSASFVPLLSSTSIIDGLGKTYLVGALNFTSSVKLKNITFKPIPSFAGTTLITFSGNDVALDISVDANNKGFTCVDITGNRARGVVRGSNILGVLQASGGTQSACRVTGQDCKIDVYGLNLLRGASDNDSIPRIATADLSGGGTGNNNTIRCYGLNTNAGLVVSQPQTYSPEIFIDGLTDNGIYHLGGRLDCGSVTLKNSLDEGVVTEGTLNIGRLHMINPMGSSGLQTGNLTIGEYLIESDDPSRSYVPLRTRVGNTTSNVSIQSLTGKIYLVDVAAGAGIFQFAAGAVGSLKVDNINLEVHYRTGSTKGLCTYASATEFNLGSVNISLIDETGTLTIADKFDFGLPTITRASYVGSVQNVSSTGEIRITNWLQPLVSIAPSLEVSTTIGPYILQENSVTPCPGTSIGPSVPTTGTWPRGYVLVLKSPFISGVSEYTCTTGGTPGTWRASKWIVGRGTTRPTLTANDVGVMFMDNTLDSDGKPIWWNGTAWVDATGAVV